MTKGYPERTHKIPLRQSNKRPGWTAQSTADPIHFFLNGYIFFPIAAFSASSRRRKINGRPSHSARGVQSARHNTFLCKPEYVTANGPPWTRYPEDSIWADGIDSWGERKRKKVWKGKGKRKRGRRREGKKKKKKREPCRGVSMPMFQGCSEICGCRLPAKVVGRLRGEEFPHLEAASSARSAWVRRLCAPRAVIVIEVMLHETNPRFPAACFLADSNTRISVLFKSRSDLTLSSGKFLILPPKCICIYTSFGKIWWRIDYMAWKLFNE